MKFYSAADSLKIGKIGRETTNLPTVWYFRICAWKTTLTLIIILPLQLLLPCFVVCLSNTLYKKTGNFADSVFIPICAGAAPAW